ncbi:hypothetical protein DV515_00013058 [Chloebia gouldiae]|uniref:Uncharacterized protein n=1 Tax=Chloebia gouldiae TaxID=44316 RepID=A0A3L8S284_CHLGU|nr:hypothetical protein DV515_00013058 [Chloebia gouldiae]
MAAVTGSAILTFPLEFVPFPRRGRVKQVTEYSKIDLIHGLGCRSQLRFPTLREGVCQISTCSLDLWELRVGLVTEILFDCVGLTQWEV